MPGLIGRTLGEYQIIEQIGEGGMATVYKGFQPSLDREVAIKVLPPYYSKQDDSFLKRFKREARAVAKLRHPNILLVITYGEVDDITYIVMEYVEAGTLQDRMQSKLTLKEIEIFISQIASALDYAHGEGVVHRDIKPSNILIPKPDWSLLTDFGLAKMVESDVITQSGLTVGTPAYMAPEQGSGNPADARSDIYSLGVTLFEMVVGEVPYTAETPMAVVVKHIIDPLPIPRSINPRVPKDIERIILKAMAKKPGDRYQRAGELANALQAAINKMNPTEKKVFEDESVPLQYKATAPPIPVSAPKPQKRPKKKSSILPAIATFGGIFGILAALVIIGTLSLYVLYNQGFLDDWLPRGNDLVTEVVITEIAEVDPVPPPSTAVAETSTVTNTPPEPTIAVTTNPQPGTSQEELSDGSTLFIDSDRGYKIVVPADWAILELSDDQIEDLATLGLGAFPEMEESLEALVFEASTNNFRMLAISTNPDFFSFEFASNLNITVADQPGSEFLPLNLITDITAQSLPDMISGLVLLNTEVGENAMGIPIGFISSQLTMGIGEPVFQKMVLFLIQDGIAIITMSTSESMRVEVEASFDIMVDTLERLE